MPRVFDRFFRVGQSRSREAEGAGLGIAIVKLICSAHGGSAEVESAQDYGNDLSATLPLSKHQNPAKKSQ